MPQDAASDEALMQAYAAGDADAFAELYGRYRLRLYGYLKRKLGRDAGRADELFQDCWTRVIAARARYQPKARFSAWLFRIAHNLLVDRLRQASNDPVAYADPEVLAETAVDADPQPVEVLIGEEQQARLRAAIAALPAEQRDCYLLREDGGLDLHEIAEITGVGLETAKSRLRYAIKALRAALDDADGNGRSA